MAKICLSGAVGDQEKDSDQEKEPLSSEDTQKPSTSRFGENQSTVVSRVPNKSVEDLYHADCVSCPGATGLSPLSLHGTSHAGLDPSSLEYEQESPENLGACGGKLENTENQSDFSAGTEKDVDDIRIEGKILQKLLNTDKIDIPYQEIMPSGASGFGVIKDISVSNLHIGDSDKTKEFSKKDLTGLSKPKTASERGNGRLFAANTPGEDDKVFSLLSPESDFSESSSSEVWGFRPLRMEDQQPAQQQQQTPETDSSIDTCSCADLPNQNEHYLHGDVSSPVIGSDFYCSNLPSGSKQIASKDMSILEMTESLVQMTRHMQDCLHLDNFNDSGETEKLQNITEPVFVDDTLPEPPSGDLNECEGDVTPHLFARTANQNPGDTDMDQSIPDPLEVQEVDRESEREDTGVNAGEISTEEASNENSGDIATVTRDITPDEAIFDPADLERSTYV